MLVSRVVDTLVPRTKAAWACSILGLIFAGAQAFGCGTSDKSRAANCTTAVAVPCVGGTGCPGLLTCSQGSPSEWGWEGVAPTRGPADPGHAADEPLDSSASRSIPDS